MAATETLPSNLYEVLGLDRRASPDEVRAAYRLRSHMFHPDKYQNYPEPLRTQLLAEAAKEFKRLTQAYDTLRDPAKRAAHNRQLDTTWSRPAARHAAAPSSTRSRAGSRKATPGHATVRDAQEVDAEEEKRARREERARQRAAAAAAEAAKPRERDPQLVVRPDTLDFGALALGTTKQLPLKVANAGGRTLFGEISTNRSWLTVNRRSFVSSSILILVQVDTNGLRAGEEYSGSLVVSTLNGGDQVVPVELRVSGKPEPLLAGVPSLLDFGVADPTLTGATKTRTIRLTNGGTGTLIGSIATRVNEGDWLSVSETRFRANDVSFEVICRPHGLPGGEHQGEVLIFTNGGQARVQVILQTSPGVTLARQSESDESEDEATAPPPERVQPASTQAVAALDKAERDALLKRIVLIEPESVWERDFLRRIVQLIRSDTPLAPGELAKIFEMEARGPAQEPL
jgi:curved DNA-binding protein CbpA